MMFAVFWERCDGQDLLPTHDGMPNVDDYRDTDNTIFTVQIARTLFARVFASHS